MKMMLPDDAFATGMVHWSESELELTPSLDRWQFSLLRPHLGRKLLGIGAGGGRITALVAEDGCRDGQVAVEPSPHFFSLLQIGAGKAPKTTPTETEAEKLLPEYHEHFDSVYSVRVMEHISAAQAYLPGSTGWRR
jgi:2-polyprenyl-3-methyl-5-hydroxy-6-metoxy-1,4-benzoquinol methylase